MSDRKGPDPEISRRTFLRLGGALSGSTLAGCAPLVLRDEKDVAGFDREVDVVVVGTGAAGGAAAITAHDSGAETLIVEKSLIYGGTTAKSGGVYWIPGSSIEAANGLAESRSTTLRKLAQACYPAHFVAEAPDYGVPAAEWSLLEALYDEGPQAVDALAASGALHTISAQVMVGAMPEYYEEPGEGGVVDRRLMVGSPDGSFAGFGDELVRQLKRAVEERGISLLMGHAARRLIQNSNGDVVGLEVRSLAGKSIRIRARRGVVFGSGGYTHNRELTLHYQPGPIYGGCAVPTNEGDFVYIAQAAGARLGHMQSAWRSQIVLEQALRFSSTPDVVFMPPGDSMILVNRLGVRVVNEKTNYHERSWAHFDWDAYRKEWINQILVMIYDDRTAKLYGGNYPVPPTGTSAPYVLEGETLEDLAARIDERLEALSTRTGGVRLDPAFAQALRATVTRFNRFAREGRDPDHRRGEQAYDRAWHLRGYSEPNPDQLETYPLNPRNPTLHAISDRGPYRAILLAAGTLDTNGGPVVDSQARVVHANGEPIRGLYGAGNCIAAPMPFYYAGGGTIAGALTFGYLAGRSAASSPVTQLS
jgi:succinate dehydrogenase/fumarate reductase flavoprotein subunit